MTPTTAILADNLATPQSLITTMLHKNGVIPRFFFGNPILEGFAIIHDGIPYVAINQSLPIDTQLHIAKRELAHILLGHLEEGKSSIFLSEFQKRQADAEVRKGSAAQ